MTRPLLSSTTSATAPVTTPSPVPAPVSRRIRTAYLGLTLGLVLSTLDQFLVSNALPAVLDDLGRPGRLPWIVDGFMLGLSVSTPLWSKVGDRLGRRRTYVAVVVLFLVGSLACALAPSMTMLIAARVLQGLGAGGILGTVFPAIGQMFDADARPRYQGYTAIVFAVASAAGPVVGGVITETLGWRWMFLVNIPVGIVAVVLVWRTLDLPAPPTRAPIDLTGALTLAAAATGLALVTSWGGTEHEWTSPIVVGTALVSLLLLVVWVRIERRAPDPIVPLGIFRRPVVVVSCVITFLAGIGIVALTSYLPLYLQAASGLSAIRSGALLVPMMVGLAVASTLVGRRMAATRRFRWYPLVSMAVATVAALLLSTLDGTSTQLEIAAYTVLLGVGSGLSMQVFVSAVQGAVEPRFFGPATSMVTFSRLIGASIGVVAFGSIVNARFATELGRRAPVLSASLPHDTHDRIEVISISSRWLQELRAGQQDVFAQSYAVSLHGVFLAAAATLAVATVLALVFAVLARTRRRVGAHHRPGRIAMPVVVLRPPAPDPVRSPVAASYVRRHRADPLRARV